MFCYYRRPSQCLHMGIFMPAFLFVGMMAGCGSNSPYEYVKVSGKVTFEDGSPIHAKDIRVVFVPQDVPTTSGGPKPRYGTATVNPENGTFDLVTSYQYGDGISVGTHRVMVIATGFQTPSDTLLPEYADPDKTPLEVHTDDTPFHLKVKRLSAN